MLSKASKQTKPSKVLCRDAYGEGVIFYVGNYKLQTQSSKQFLLGREQGYGRACRAPKDAGRSAPHGGEGLVLLPQCQLPACVASQIPDRLKNLDLSRLRVLRTACDVLQNATPARVRGGRKAVSPCPLSALASSNPALCDRHPSPG